MNRRSFPIVVPHSVATHCVETHCVDVKRHIKKRVKLGGELGTLAYYGGEFIDACPIRFHFAPSTTQGHHKRLKTFLNWCLDRELELPSEISTEVLLGFSKYLSLRKTVRGTHLSTSSLCGYLHTLKRFFGWLYKVEHIEKDPAADLEYPRQIKRLPRDILSEKEVKQVLRSVDLNQPRHLRDRAMMELFYSSGLRRLELVRLGLNDVHFKEKIVFVKEGKGAKDRYVPIGERAVFWLNRYLKEVRPRVVWGKDPGYLFLTMKGEELSPGYVTHTMCKIVKESGVNKKGACHIFRHTMASQMLDGGADIRHIQSILGHSSIRTTEIYTHVSLQKLKDVHEKTHPAAGLESAK